MAQKVRMTQGKLNGIQAVADDRGIIAAAAMDQRGSLKKAIAKAKGTDATDAELTEFKVLGTRLLTRYMTEFSRPQYGVDVLKVEVPVNVKYVEGSLAYEGTRAYTLEEAKQHFRRAA